MLGYRRLGHVGPSRLHDGDFLFIDLTVAPQATQAGSKQHRPGAFHVERRLVCTPFPLGFFVPLQT